VRYNYKYLRASLLVERVESIRKRDSPGRTIILGSTKLAHSREKTSLSLVRGVC